MKKRKRNSLENAQLVTLRFSIMVLRTEVHGEDYFPIFFSQSNQGSQVIPDNLRFRCAARCEINYRASYPELSWLLRRNIQPLLPPPPLLRRVYKPPLTYRRSCRVNFSISCTKLLKDRHGTPRLRRRTIDYSFDILTFLAGGSRFGRGMINEPLTSRGERVGKRAADSLDRRESS